MPENYEEWQERHKYDDPCNAPSNTGFIDVLAAATASLMVLGVAFALCWLLTQAVVRANERCCPVTPDTAHPCQTIGTKQNEN